MLVLLLKVGICNILPLGFLFVVLDFCKDNIFGFSILSEYFLRSSTEHTAIMEYTMGNIFKEFSQQDLKIVFIIMFPNKMCFVNKIVFLNIGSSLVKPC